MKNVILVTGGAGYIGSHTAVELAQAGYEVVIVDNFCNSSPKVLERLRGLAGNHFQLVRADVRHGAALDRVFAEHRISAVIHFAGIKAVGESVGQPLRYVDTNVGGTLSLLQAMERAGVWQMVFSSTATVYGVPDQIPVTEDSPLRVTSPYARTKLMCEDILRDLETGNPRWNFAILRYFNPVGAHPSGLIGEHPKGTPNNLMPYITQVAAGTRPYLNIFGNDYPTPDGTGVRDYLHIVDLAKGHIAALKHLSHKQESITVNLGTGQGLSVKQLVDCFAQVTGVPVPYRYAARRPGDIAIYFADTQRAKARLGWSTQLGIEAMCLDAWRWQRKNPDGY